MSIQPASDCHMRGRGRCLVMPTTLDEVRSFMSFFGWSDGGNPGSVKRDAGGNVIAHYHDGAWIEDIERACAMMCLLHRIESTSH